MTHHTTKHKLIFETTYFITVYSYISFNFFFFLVLFFCAPMGNIITTNTFEGNKSLVMFGIIGIMAAEAPSGCLIPDNVLFKV